MRIAQVSPLFESVPPRYYGGTERVVSYLTEELVALGHEVTLFASGDSITRARLVAPCARSLRLDARCLDPLAHHLLMLEQVIGMADEFDLIHFHIDYLHFPCSRRLRTPHLSTLHGRLDIPDLVPLYHEFQEIPLVSISAAQRSPLHWANWRATIHHGLPPQLFPFVARPGAYLAFLGRISPEKGCDLAVEIARRSGLPLRVAAKVSREDQEYFESVVKPLLADPLVEFIGEIGDSEKPEFLGNALALLFPIDWEEPFGLVMVEAMACGTPVIAFRRGSVPEIIEDGVNGFVVDDVEAAVANIPRLAGLRRRACREIFERRFSAARMAGDYLRLYQQMLPDRFAPGSLHLSN